MSKTYEIMTKPDMVTVFSKMTEYMKSREIKGLPFQPMTIVCKRYKKPKTSAQHRKYFALIGKLKPLFRDAGYEVNESDINNFLKYKSGFTKIINCVVITKSIADASDDASIEALNNLIEYALRYAIENFEVDLEGAF